MLSGILTVSRSCLATIERHGESQQVGHAYSILLCNCVVACCCIYSACILLFWMIWTGYEDIGLQIKMGLSCVDVMFSYNVARYPHKLLGVCIQLC